MSDQQKYTSKLTGSRILIFGGSSGIGYGVAEATLENGAIVFISSSSQKRVDDAVSRLQKSYPSKRDHVKGIVANLGSEDMEQNIVAALKKATEGGKLDHCEEQLDQYEEQLNHYERKLGQDGRQLGDDKEKVTVAGKNSK